MRLQPYPATILALLALSGASAPAADDPQSRPYPHGNWSQDCSLCHRPEKWLPVVKSKEFRHPDRVPLTGAHASATCRACHKSLDFSTAARDCADCHQDVHRGEFGLDCVRCHTTRDFLDRANAVRTHRTTLFPLTGAHTAADCAACHRIATSGRNTYKGLDSDCAACHNDPARFPAAVQRPPDHETNQFPLDCNQCHTTIAFQAARFNHAVTGFPLDGRHTSLACANCHGEPFRRDLDPTCVACHRDDYDRTNDPNHAQAQFPTDCRLCHTTGGWEGASFDHQATQFPLTGAHVGRSCSACHSDGVYDGKPTDCYSCHRDDYERTSDPNHVAANFSRTCTACHTTATFDGARYTEHDARSFPIYSGTHNGRWDRCSDCHTTSGSYSAFSCFRCHSQDETGSDHRDVRDYSYDSNACYRCHPTGQGED